MAGQKDNSVLSAQGYIVCDMKRTIPWTDSVDVISSDESSSSDSGIELNDGIGGQRLSSYVTIDQPIKEMTSGDLLIRRAEMYQDYMKHIPIPAQRGSAIPFSSWVGLGKSVKQLYRQPLHYLTNILLYKWDQQRIGSDDEYTPLDTMMHPCKAEATIWLVEEVHRRTSSHYHVAKIWQSDPMHHAFVDSIFPQL
ncbi:hypothetical protein OIU76_014065 [Salix suchowensis]|uniref:Protein RDM1 n=1 Tax=Salix suchowensis TaxID=1278906 RepID=A0ABQ9A2A4_9ROSI|nr:hypothetical protein OIU76_014065 [Salix suchowensis]KAJ6321714.1 hypothetical protein OIU77_011732 [Salix suchowensis]